MKDTYTDADADADADITGLREAVEPEEREIDYGPLAQQNQHNLTSEAPGEDVTDQMLREDVNRADSWLVYNKGLEQTGYSPADRLTPDNVDSLELAWSIETDSAGLETAPLVVPGDPPVMYFTTSNYSIRAVNARNGDSFWEFKYGIDQSDETINTTGRQRGVGIWGDKVYFGTAAKTLVALDRYTGEFQWEDDVIAGAQRDRPQRISITEAPLVYEGRAFTGQYGDSAMWTILHATDAQSGETLWQKKTAPPSEWVGETWEFSSAAAWMSPTVDPESNTLFWSVANPDPMLNTVVRPGPNRHSNSVVAVDPSSGDFKWAHQVIPNEAWDYDVMATPTVFDMEVDGEQRRVVSTSWKAGWTEIIDVETGQLVERSEPTATQRHQFGSYPDSQFLNLPPAGEANAAPMWPALNGAKEWPPEGYSPKTGMRYVGAADYAHLAYYDPNWEVPSDPEERGGVGGGILTPEGVEFKATVAAVDLATGEVPWRYELQDVDPDTEPALLWTGGTTPTAGNLVFHGSSGGHLLALDAETGQRLGRADTGGRITAGPVVWDDPQQNQQYVTVAANDTVVSYVGGD